MVSILSPHGVGTYVINVIFFSGNPLGTRYKACQTAGESISSARRKSSTPIHPEGPRYWRAHLPQHSSSSAEFYIYSFFSHAVSPSPRFSFPTRRATVLSPAPIYPLSPSMQAQTRTQLDQETDSSENDDNTATYTNTMFDRFMTASPVPLSETNAEGRRSLSAGRGLRANAPLQALVPGMVSTDRQEFDPDGEYILDNEPGSPDKTNEAMLLPER